MYLDFRKDIKNISKGESHNAARMKIANILLHLIWCEWKKLEGIDVINNDEITISQVIMEDKKISLSKRKTKITK